MHVKVTSSRLAKATKIGKFRTLSLKIRGPIVIFLVAAMIASVLAIYSRHHQGTLTSQPVAIQSEALSSNLSSSAAVSQATTPPQNGAAAEKIANSTPLQAEA